MVALMIITFLMSASVANELIVGDNSALSTYQGVTVRCGHWDGNLCKLPEFQISGDFYRLYSNWNCAGAGPQLFCLAATQGRDGAFPQRVSGRKDSSFGSSKRWTLKIGNSQCDASAPGFETLSADGVSVSGFPQNTDSLSYDWIECNWASQTPPDCNSCVNQFEAAGGCDCMADPTGACDVDALIPSGCDSCGPQAVAHCSSSVSSTCPMKDGYSCSPGHCVNSANVRPTYTSLGKPIDYDTCANMCGSDPTCLAFQHNHFPDAGRASIDHCYRMTTETVSGDRLADRACCCVKSQPADCDTCVSQFAAAGGCDCMNDPTGTCDVDSMIPTGCHSCGPQAHSHCSTVTMGPTFAPTKEPTSAPTEACHWDFYADGYIAGFQQSSWNTISFNSGAGGSSAVHDLTLVQCGELCDSEANCDSFDWIRGFCNLRTCDPQSDTGCDIRPDARPNGWNVYVKKCNVQEPTPAPTDACHWDFYADGYIGGFQQSSWNSISFNGGAGRSRAVKDLTLVQCGQLCDSEANCDSFDFTGGFCNLRTCDPRSDTGCDIRPDSRPNGWNVYVKVCNVPYTGDAWFCDTYGDPHINTWHLQGTFAERIDLGVDSGFPNGPTGRSVADSHAGEYLMIQYGAYKVFTTANRRTLNTKITVQKGGRDVYVFDGYTGTTTVPDASLVTFRDATAAEKQWTPLGVYALSGTYEYGHVQFADLPLEFVWVQETRRRNGIPNCAGCAHDVADTKGYITDITFRWHERPGLLTGLCGATAATALSFKTADYSYSRRQLSQQAPPTCPILDQCCSRLAGQFHEFQACLLDEHSSCCAEGAELGDCCGSYNQDAPRCTADSCVEGFECNMIDGYCYPSQQVADVTAFVGSCNGQTDLNAADEHCALQNGELVCEPVILTQCPGSTDLAPAYLTKSMGGSSSVLYGSCQFEWYAEWSCEPPVIQCPREYTQIGNAGADIDGCGLGCSNEFLTIEECSHACDSNEACIAFTFARPTESPTNDFRCALYDSAAPTTTQGSHIFCKSLNAPLVGDISFTQRFANIDDCDDFLLILKSAVATVAQVELRLVETTVADCQNADFTYKISADSASALETLQDTNEIEFPKRVAIELSSVHGFKVAAAQKENKSSSKSKVNLILLVVGCIACVLAIIAASIYFRSGCFNNDGTSTKDIELGEKRTPGTAN